MHCRDYTIGGVIVRHIKKSILTALALTAMLTTVGVESRSCMSVKAEGISYTATEATRYAAPASYYSSVHQNHLMPA